MIESNFSIIFFLPVYTPDFGERKISVFIRSLVNPMLITVLLHSIKVVGDITLRTDKVLSILKNPVLQTPGFFDA